MTANTKMGVSRRELLSGVLAGAVAACTAESNSDSAARIIGGDPERDFGNFRSVYGNPQQRAAFRSFLTTVFRLYPEQEFDELIARYAADGATDGSVYAAVADHLAEISPFLGSLRYALPALSKQKAEMANQTARLLDDMDRVVGYLEVGSHGRYLDKLSERLDVVGPVYTTAPVPATSSLVDMLDRGGILLPGSVVPWDDYAGFEGCGIEPGSIDLVTIYIGLHHAKPDTRERYLHGLRQLLSDRGRVVIRDHDVTTEELRALVGLAHDVFNVGTHEPWHVNAAERRNFYTLDYLTRLFESQGFRALPGRLLQDGDPTRNTLLSFSKA